MEFRKVYTLIQTCSSLKTGKRVKGTLLYPFHEENRNGKVLLFFPKRGTTAGAMIRPLSLGIPHLTERWMTNLETLSIRKTLSEDKLGL